MNPTELDCLIIDWFSRRVRTRWAGIPQHWKPTIRRHLSEDRDASTRWLERCNVHEVRITPLGRMLAAAYRLGRAAAPREESRTG